jgi:prepilin-type N-terminal cleavage/methylation domain-containing protein
MRRRRPGLTLIEFLIVVSIIGLLLALLVPAVQSSREAARRTMCANQLRQIDEAVLRHATVGGMLPSLYNGSFLPRPRAAVDEFHFHSWRSAILPLIEQSATYSSLNLELPSTTPPNQTGLNVQVAAFLCPSTSNDNVNVPDILEWNDGKIPAKPVGTAARSDYEAVGGVSVPMRLGTDPDLTPVTQYGAWGEPTYDLATGAALRYRKARLADVVDGMSHTLLIAERAGRPDFYRKGEPADPYPYSGPTKGPDYHQAAWGISTHFAWLVYPEWQPVNYTNSTGSFSFHPGANVALGDGSVRFLTESTAPAILKALATRAGAEVVGLD